MALPFLPGNTFNRNLGKVQYHKSHHFDQANDVLMMVGEAKPGIGGELLPGQKLRPRNSAIPRGTGSALPAWVAFDRQVLCFDAYFMEGVHEKREEQYRVHQCKVYFYLEDDSIQVAEPRLKNAGIPQGTLIRRHRIPKPPPNDDQFYTVEDFNVGNELYMYSRTFKLTGCDEFTRNFLLKLGVKVPLPDEAPNDPYMNHRKALDESMQPLRPYEKKDNLKQFLDHDRHVLRFQCYWDDSDSMFGDPRELVLHYFLADDTIEIREIIRPNSGRDATPMFLKREALPKGVVPLRQPGEATDRTVLNVFGPMGHGGRYILDSLKTGAVNQEYYTDRDLTLGAVINVWGRKVILCDCDEFTKEYYRTKYGVNDFTPINYKNRGMPTSGTQKEMPPYNGFGSEEDSLCSCMGLLPKPPRRDFIKFMEKDRRGLDSNVLRFLARMDTTNSIDQERRFIVSYFLADDTIQVYEPPVRNSGVIGGKFLERGRVKKPNQPMFSTQLSEYYRSDDLYVGAVVEFNSHRFVIMDADQYAYNYMERHSCEFPQADAGQILPRVKKAVEGQLDKIMREHPMASAVVLNFEQFRQFLKDICGSALTHHEIITLARVYQARAENPTDINTLTALAQDSLRKDNFEDFAKISEQCAQYDSKSCGFLPVESLRTVCQSQKVPIPDDLLRSLLSSMPTNDPGEVNYNDFVKIINWRENPMNPISTTTESADEYQGAPHKDQIKSINFSLFVSDLKQG